MTIFRDRKGFTLIEAVISLFLLAVMSVMGYQAVEVVLGSNQRSRADLAEEAQLQRAWRIIAQDLLHMRARTFADGFGEQEPAYYTGTAGFIVRFSRGGGPMLQSNPSGLTRVSYELNEEQQLLRRSWPISAMQRFDEGRVQLLLESIEQVRFEHLTKDYFYAPDWPPLNESHGLRSLPKMVRVTLVFEDGNETSRLLPGVEFDD